MADIFFNVFTPQMKLIKVTGDMVLKQGIVQDKKGKKCHFKIMLPKNWFLGESEQSADKRICKFIVKLSYHYTCTFENILLGRHFIHSSENLKVQSNENHGGS